MKILAAFQLITEEVRIITHPGFKNEPVKLDYHISRETATTEDGKTSVSLIFELKNDETHQYPFEAYLKLTGLFNFEPKISEPELDGFTKIQAVQILFPYLRSMITNITAGIYIQPLVLPIINAAEVFNDLQETPDSSI